jgi:hypothetical protein
MELEAVAAAPALHPSVSLIDSCVVTRGSMKHVEYSVLVVVVAGPSREMRWWKVSRR